MEKLHPDVRRYGRKFDETLEREFGIQKNAAEKLNVSEALLSRISSGQRSVSYNVFGSLLEALEEKGADSEELVEGYARLVENELVENYSHSPESRRKISRSKTGQKFTDEARRNMSIAQRRSRKP